MGNITCQQVDSNFDVKFSLDIKKEKIYKINHMKSELMSNKNIKHFLTGTESVTLARWKWLRFLQTNAIQHFLDREMVNKIVISVIEIFLWNYEASFKKDVSQWKTLFKPITYRNFLTISMVFLFKV